MATAAPTRISPSQTPIRAAPRARTRTGAALVDRDDLQRSPLERLEALCDRDSLRVIRSEVRSLQMREKSRAGDGVVGGTGLVDGRPVFCYAQDSSYAGGSLGAAHADTIVRVLELAGRAGAPVVGFVSSGGARMQEGGAALGGYGRIFTQTVALSGRVPQISIITGVSAGGGAYSPALTDWTVMTEDSSMFLTGPGVVREALGEEVTAEALGGTRVHQRNGVCHFVAPTDVDAAYLARDLLAYLPSRRGAPVPHAPARPASGRDPGTCVPSQARRVYDIRDVIGCLADGGRAARGVGRLGAEPRHGAGTDRWSRGGRDRQPAAVPRRRSRRRQLAEGRPVREQVQRLWGPVCWYSSTRRDTCRALVRSRQV